MDTAESNTFNDQECKMEPKKIDYVYGNDLPKNRPIEERCQICKITFSSMRQLIKHKKVHAKKYIHVNTVTRFL